MKFVFNGHAHIYERNSQQPGENFVSYVTGGGGATLEPIGPMPPVDAFGIGWSPTAEGERVRFGPRADLDQQVFHFLLVTVAGTTVTVTPTDSLGNHPFDVHTYTFGSTGAGHHPHREEPGIRRRRRGRARCALRAPGAHPLGPSPAAPPRVGRQRAQTSLTTGSWP